VVHVDPKVATVDATKDPSIHQAIEQVMGEITDDRAVLEQR
jgi:hypothetical protein